MPVSLTMPGYRARRPHKADPAAQLTPTIMQDSGNLGDVIPCGGTSIGLDIDNGKRGI